MDVIFQSGERISPKTAVFYQFELQTMTKNHPNTPYFPTNAKGRTGDAK